MVPADPVAETNAGQPKAAVALAQRLEDVLGGAPGDHVVGDVVPELAELVEDDRVGVPVEDRAGVVDLLDVRFRARRADDVGRVADPGRQPVEALLAHALGQHRHAVALHDPADGHAAAAVVAGRGPDGALAGGVELAGDDARRQAAVGGDDLVRVDHREAVAEQDDDGRRRRRSARAAGRRARAGPAGRVSLVGCTSAPGTGCADGERRARRSRTSAATSPGIVLGSASCAKEGMTMPASRNRLTVRS